MTLLKRHNDIASAFEAHEAHEAHHHTCRFLDERSQHLACPPEVWRLGTADGVIAGDGFGGGFQTHG
jgi:hypothetical protein